MNKYRIVNGKRLIMSCVLFLIFVIAISIVISKESLSCTEIEYKDVEVISGDTLWSIAQEEQLYNDYYDNKDIRYIISDLKQVNNLKNSNLDVGQKIVIPCL